MITTPIFMIFSIICEILVKILLWCLKNQANTMLAWAQFTYSVAKTAITDSLAQATEKQAEMSLDASEEMVGDIAGGTTEEVTGAPLEAAIITAPAGAADEAMGVASDIAGGEGVTAVTTGTGAAISNRKWNIMEYDLSVRCSNYCYISSIFTCYDNGSSNCFDSINSACYLFMGI